MPEAWRGIFRVLDLLDPLNQYIEIDPSGPTIRGEPSLSIDSAILSLTGDLDITGDFECQNADIFGDLGVTGLSTFHGTVLFGDNAQFDQVLDIQGYITNSEGVLALQSDVGIFGDLDVGGVLTVGVNDTGHDVKFYGATSGKYMLWDESADGLRLEGLMGIGANPNTIADIYLAGSRNNRGIQINRIVTTATHGLTSSDTCHHNTGGYLGFNSAPTMAAVGTTPTLSTFGGGDILPLVISCSAGTTIATLYGLAIKPTLADANVTVADFLGILIEPTTVSSTITKASLLRVKQGAAFIATITNDLIGVEIGDMIQASGVNYAIKTGLGLVHLGGDVMAAKSGGNLGFFGTAPVAIQTLASDTLANLLTALRNYGFIV
jgi:hypothetical protein